MFKTPQDKNYELIDSGNEMKLERFGNITLARPEPEAIWNKSRPEIWDSVDYFYDRDTKAKWNKKRDIPESWEIAYGGVNLWIKPTAFKHTGLFPEQISNWKYLEKISAGRKLKILNLFGYTGAFSVFALSLGHEVTHVDSSQGINDWLKENVKINRVDSGKLKIITDDVTAFIKRLVKRGETYDIIILDPPAFGHGAKASELWKIEEDLPHLISSLGLILTPKPTGIILSGYAAGYSPETYKNLLLPIADAFGGVVEADTMTIEESGTKRMLTIGIAARWSNT
jgi:23S rRNA (cytosine1962-C5)-methyltransferase